MQEAFIGRGLEDKWGILCNFLIEHIIYYQLSTNDMTEYDHYE